MCIRDRFQSGEALYYGLNALSNNMILCDRKRLKNPNGLILGTPGSGKSFSAKREITNAFLITAAVSYTHLRAHETRHDLVCRLLLEKKKHISETTRLGMISYAFFCLKKKIKEKKKKTAEVEQSICTEEQYD